MIRVLCLLLFINLGSSAWASAPALKPNIIVILVDDMGFSDLGCYGSEIPTPNIDSLAKNGVRFTQFYNTGRCCPTRAVLLTGLYSHQTGVGHMTTDDKLPGYEGRLNENCTTIAEALKPAGYFTAMTGKWHVGQNHGVVPWERGFERNLTAAAGGFYFPDDKKSKLFLNGEAVAKDDPRIPKDWYSTDLWTSFGLKFIDEAISEKKPFYLHLCHNAPHFPLQAPAKEIEKFRGKYKRGWDALREERLKKQRELGLIADEWSPSIRPETIQSWDSLTEEEKDRFDHIMAVYAAVVSHIDRSIGDLVARLKERGVLDNTLILLMSDNGGNAESGPNGRTDGDPANAASNWFCGESWAYLQNTPFRKYKHFNHEGGISSPLIAHWPAQIKAESGSSEGRLVTTPAHLIDILPTCLEIGGAVYPDKREGHDVLPPEGLSLVTLLKDPQQAQIAFTTRTLYWEHEGNAALRQGNLKLVRAGRQNAWELFDVSKDRTEQHNLASEQPEKVKELTQQWRAWAQRVHALPFPKKAPKGNQPNKKTQKSAKADAVES